MDRAQVTHLTVKGTVGKGHCLRIAANEISHSLPQPSFACLLLLIKDKGILGCASKDWNKTEMPTLTTSVHNSIRKVEHGGTHLLFQHLGG